MPSAGGRRPAARVPGSGRHPLHHRIFAREEDRLMSIIPPHAVPAMPGTSDHLEHLCQPVLPADAVLVNGDHGSGSDLVVSFHDRLLRPAWSHRSIGAKAFDRMRGMSDTRRGIPTIEAPCRRGGLILLRGPGGIDAGPPGTAR